MIIHIIVCTEETVSGVWGKDGFGTSFVRRGDSDCTTDRILSVMLGIEIERSWHRLISAGWPGDVISLCVATSGDADYLILSRAVCFVLESALLFELALLG